MRCDDSRRVFNAFIAALVALQITYTFSIVCLFWRRLLVAQASTISLFTIFKKKQWCIGSVLTKTIAFLIRH
jgi:hypothetical protein